MTGALSLRPGRRVGSVVAPPSKSHAHRLLIANFLAGDESVAEPQSGDNDDVAATRRCLRALAGTDAAPELDCGESGSTLRFLAPVAAALGKRPTFVRRGRLAARPFRAYDGLVSGAFELPGDVSSQFATGLLFALPLLKGDSTLRFTSPLESRGYVELTVKVLEKAGIEIVSEGDGYRIPGGQRYRPQAATPEGDWSGAAAWLAMNALGSDVRVEGLDAASAQPDRVVADWLPDLPATVDVSQSPDLFPVVSVVAAGLPRTTTFVGIRRLRLKECDRVEAMRETLVRFGAGVEVTEGAFAVKGTAGAFHGGDFRTFGDHRIAMAAAVGATRAEAPVVIDNAACVAKSYPPFFNLFARL